MKRPAFDAAEFQATLARLKAGTDYGSDKNRVFDPVLHRDVIAESVKGRKIENYKVALEAMGFRYIPPTHLPPYPNGSMHTEGEWRCSRYRMAFTDNEVLAWFASPEELVKWVQRAVLKKQMQRAGLVMPR